MIKKREIQILLALIGCFLVSVIFASVYRYDNQKTVVSGKAVDYAAAQEYSWYIDSVTKNAKQVVVEGWAAKLGSDLAYVNRNVVLIDSQGELHHLNTVMVKRTSVTEHFKDGHNYDNSGIRAACMLKDLEPGRAYAVGIIVKEQNGSQYLIKTDKTVTG